MGYLLFVILSLISIGCFLEGKKVERRGLNLALSLLLSIIIPIVMTGSLESLFLSQKIVGYSYSAMHTVIPAIAFLLFHLLFLILNLMNRFAK